MLRGSAIFSFQVKCHKHKKDFLEEMPAASTPLPATDHVLGHARPVLSGSHNPSSQDTRLSSPLHAHYCTSLSPTPAGRTTQK